MTVRCNNFDSIRLIAALTVILSHTVPLSYGNNERELIWRLSHGQTTAGTIAVIVFFAMSGYLITESFQRSRSARAFVLARALRLLPALAVVLLLLALAVGPMFSSLPAGSYFRTPAVYTFILRNLIFRYIDNLPGVFQSNPYPGVVDGSIATLKYEAECYLIVLGLGIAGLLGRWISASIYGAALVAICVLPHASNVNLIAVFLGGAVINLFRPRLSIWPAGICLAGWAASLVFGQELLASALFGPYLAIYCALSPSVRLPNLARFGDLSYGVYIFAFPVQQIIVNVHAGAVSWWMNFCLATAVAMMLALISWHAIEAPSLRLKARLVGRTARDVVQRTAARPGLPGLIVHSGLQHEALPCASASHESS
jgi:peptidoglycan/LPS O-acetylase OafA/YrhL